MSEENDPAIRVTIRTGTSTRPPIIRERQSNIDISIGFSILPTNYIDRDFLDAILQRSFQESGELKRNPDIELDIECRNCKPEEIGQECSICFLKFTSGQKLSTLDNCDHTFHYNCISEWGKYKQSCALCREPIDIVPV